ncbi:purine-nucleoside phosphorylase [Thalassorhabdomicrobium marinisediminis]|uniref:Purine nucleoside phosphorylase n=1 Tax=Thalassorhabdomicrobium marinisediminis TaxID=2170577 RepID=A0A2T7FTI3_9RHOB|nr:purine-nucleoside phosphorylase [Thalassorhabdomicrobium marinisediminis]PVA05475.1 purine-nucleoside phosphorylase [Thalassorhabdomicrobium marinisediminis]
MLKAQVLEAVEAIRKRSDVVPELALVLGSGLGPLADHIDGVTIPYSEIPHFPVSTVQGHDGVLIVGTLFGRTCVAMRGRVHMYEGYSAQEVTFPMRVMAALGATTTVITNAAGGMGDGMVVGDIVAIEDHLSLAVAAGFDPLRGPNEPAFGERFVSMNKAYDPELIALVQSLSPMVSRGVYGHAIGPSFEPPALIRFLKQAGVDLVGMSTVPEVIVARHMGLKVLALSAVTNIAVSSVNDAHVTNEDEVWEAVKLVQPKLLTLMEALIPVLPRADSGSAA